MSSYSKANSSGQPGFVFAADLGGTHLRSAIVDDTGKIRFRIKAPTPKVTDPNEIVRELVVAARECERRNAENSTAIRAASVVVAGTVDVSGTVVLQGLIFHTWMGFP